MSRIHEALQRAGNEHPSAVAAVEETDPPLTDAGQEIGTLSREPYPVEIDAGRRLRVQPPEPSPVIAPAPPAARTDEHEPAKAKDPGKILFERIDARLAEKIVVDGNMSQLSREQYRRLAAVLHDAQGNTGLRVIMIASALPGEGKTLTATNVALTLSDSYHRRVLLIDADLRKPALHQVFRLNAASGLLDSLEAPTEVKLLLRQVSTNLSVLPAGRSSADPMAALTSNRMRRLIDEAKEAFDWVIIDTPPLMLLPDAHLLSSLVDGAVLVVKANSTPYDMVKRSGDIIGRDRVLGVVLNRADAGAQPGYGGYAGYALVPRPEEKRS